MILFLNNIQGLVYNFTIKGGEMRESRWDRLYGMIAEQFKIEQEFSQEIEVSRGVKGKQEMVVFSSSQARMKLERTVRPRVVRMKSYYSRTTYRGAHQEPEYSKTETVEIIRLYRWNNKTNNWEEINLNKL